MHYRLALFVSRTSRAFRACASQRAVSIALVLALLAVARPAHADAKTEAAAKALQNKAMQEDYLATDFDKALEKLNQAATKCGEKCSSIVKAQIKRDVGVVQVAKQNHEAAVGAFTEALKADSNVQLDPDTRTKDVDAAWAEAKKQAGSGGAAAGPPPAGDFTMQPAPETLSHTPLDVYGEYSGTEQLAKVVLKYKGFGMPDWKTVEMKSMGENKGWGAEIPCADVADGDILYYLQGFNAANDPVATSGDRNNPFHTTAKRGFAGEVPHFPGKEAPKQCAETGDCPPDFPGCKKPATEAENPDANLKDEGQDCEENSECKSDKCGEDKTCKGGSKKSGKRKKFWIGLAGSIDFVDIPSGTDVCLLTSSATPVASANGYYCTVNGQDFPTRGGNGQEDLDIVKGKSDTVSPGFAPGNVRVLLSFDYAATSNLMIGVRLGYAANTYNGQSASSGVGPFHGELRGTYVIGKDALDKKGIAPYAMIGAGVAQYSAQVGVTVISQAPSGKNFGGTNSPIPPPCAATDTSCTTVAQAWNVGGPGFASLGAGIRFAFTPSIALLFGPRFNVSFGSASTLISISPELGLQFGF